MSKIKLITQTHKERQWKKVDAGFIDKLKYFATFGAFGRLEWVGYSVRDVTVFIPEATPSDSEVKEFRERREPQRPFLSSVNCRCKITKL